MTWYSDVCVCVCSVAQLCLTLCHSMDCSLPGSSDCGISQARILKWVATSYSRGYSRPEDWICISCISYFGRQILDLSWKTKKRWQMDSLPLYHLGSPVEACTEHKMGTEKGMSLVKPHICHLREPTHLLSDVAGEYQPVHSYLLMQPLIGRIQWAC